MVWGGANITLELSLENESNIALFLLILDSKTS